MPGATDDDFDDDYDEDDDEDSEREDDDDGEDDEDDDDEEEETWQVGDNSGRAVTGASVVSSVSKKFPRILDGRPGVAPGGRQPVRVCRSRWAEN